MAKTLIIKGANFSANKVATIDFDRIHTTAIALDDSTATLTTIGATKTLGYTLTPSNAEDPVQWSSSNTSVCTVSDAGVVTAVGCGSATITATSNGHSDTCTITNEIELTGFSRNPKTYIASQSSSGHASLSDTYIGLTNTGYNMYMAMLATDSTKEKLNCNLSFAKQNTETGKYYLPDTYDPSIDSPARRVITNIGYIVPIMMPNNCTSIKMVGLNAHYAPYIMWYKSETRANSSDGDQLYFSAYKLQSPTPNNYSWDFKQETVVTPETGYDSFTIMWKADTANGAVDFATLTEAQIAEFKVICS